MNLWIRSQDKEVLTRVVDIWKDCYKNEIWAQSSFAIKNCLGIYKTKERALEVLSEIQYKIKNMYILENCKLPKKSCIERSLAMDNFNIYEMPEK